MPTEARSSPFRVLLADDDEDDCYLFERALASAAAYCELRCVHDGEVLLATLREPGPEHGGPLRPWPELILLDLNMPRMDGREALAEIRSDPALRGIPVVVMTTSRAHGDIERCYALGANSFLVKPTSFDGLVDTTRGLLDYWMNLVALPTNKVEGAGGE